MRITLVKAELNDCPEIYSMQIKSFAALLDKYQDFEYSPGAEKMERTYERFHEATTDYWLIVLDKKNIGAIRICDFGEFCKLKQIFILPEFQNYGYAQEVIMEIESLYPNALKWELDTILQEEKLCSLYEKMGYIKTGKVKKLKENMDLVFYEKNLL